MIKGHLPPKEGLYDPAYEHDNCGIGFLANIHGKPAHDIIKRGMEVLVNLTHRGACGCDPETGDGTGMIMQIPDEFFRTHSDKMGFDLPANGDYGVGMLFFDQDADKRAAMQLVIEKTISEEGQTVLGWRDVPVNNTQIGWLARETEPFMRQVFIKKSDAIKDRDSFERKLFVIRKLIENYARAHETEVGFFYAPTFSCKTLAYKGLLVADKIDAYFIDMQDKSFKSAIALMHQRYSTNTFPTWSLAQPFRYLAHNGEINTLRGNINWMNARQGLFESKLFGDDIKKIFPICIPGSSDSATLDNGLELLLMSGRSLAHCICMMVPEAWSGHESMSQNKIDFYEYHSCLMEPWDGPASIVFTDGVKVGGVLDRNGLRPSRYVVTKDGFVVMSSETGVLQIDPADIVRKGRLQPGRMFLIDTEKGEITEDVELKQQLASQKPYGEWLKQHRLMIDDIQAPQNTNGAAEESLSTQKRQQVFGYTDEDLKFLIGPMADDGKEPTGSMGNDTPLAVLSDRPQLLFNYFKQLFAQVTNPPIDPIREELVMSLDVFLGSEGNVLEEKPDYCRRVRLTQPILTNEELEKLRNLDQPGLRSKTIKTLYPVAEGEAGLKAAMDRVRAEASQAIKDGFTILILSDRGVDENNAPIPALLASSGVNHHLIREGSRTRVGLVLESGEPREVQHFAVLAGFGAQAVNPYLALETTLALWDDEALKPGMDKEKSIKNYINAIDKGLLKVFSKMGVSTLQSYTGAQIFEAVGLGQELIDEYFTWTTSRIGGIGLEVIARETQLRHEYAFPPVPDGNPDLMIGGSYQWRRGGERHRMSPDSIAALQQSVKIKDYKTFKDYSAGVNNENKQHNTIRGLMEFHSTNGSIPIEEVEPAAEIVKRFCTGAMSFGSISKEAHENLAIAMNRLGGKSNTGEGGEDPIRFKPMPNGDSKRSAIKQVASGRFGVTIEYLTNADELQIKMAQGAKPGEGGQLPGHKVNEVIAKVRHSTPGVTLISPPPHHDIYSIEDLAQLIHDLKNSNPRARVSVKLVSEVGVGTIAAGVSKGKSDHVLISGDSGGTGASPMSSIKHAGLPWELGLSETQQVLVKNDLRGRIVVQTDGQMKTGRDAAVAFILGAEECGFSTAPLIASGCIMMRKCHLNTCPVGIATQNEELRKKFEGKPEHVVNFFFFIAEEIREIMASLGVRKVVDMIGHTEYLKPRQDITHWKAKTLDLQKVLHKPAEAEKHPLHNVSTQDHGLDGALDNKLIELCKDAIENKTPVKLDMPIVNINRTVGTTLSHEIAKKYALAGLPDGTIHIKFNGSAGQSFGAFLANGITMEIEGDANDYVCKGMSGGRAIVYPPKTATYVPEDNILIGNVVLYGATDGECFFRGVAGERFCVRNSGARAVVEGIGDHGCEYMTGGRTVILGTTGRNFAAGMSGGIAYIYDIDGGFKGRCNPSMVDLEPVQAASDVAELHEMIKKHFAFTGSTVAETILKDWDATLPKFIKVMPKEYRRYLNELAARAQDQQPGVAAAAK
ncbi:MAG: glutamate synthase large subunit [Candidatus Hinthialibacter antarcticus]|nr:glutamate synthase large subunit [Candidatus Hinthialibacter antarcticus]